MTTVTITEALAEIKTITKRIAGKKDFIGNYIARQETLRDPLANEGGSAEVIKRERQAIRDLEERIVSIRRAIQDENARNFISLEGMNRSIADWLVWRREIAKGQQDFLRKLRDGVLQIRREVQQKGLAIVNVENQTQGGGKDVVLNVNETEIARELETIETILGSLDGQLSLFNATHFVSF